MFILDACTVQGRYKYTTTAKIRYYYNLTNSLTNLVHKIKHNVLCLYYKYQFSQ